MLLEYFISKLDIIKTVLHFLESHSVLVGVVISLITSSLWLRMFIRQKRAEAFLGFYAKLSLRLNDLRASLEENSLLNISNSKQGNIYALIYTENCMNIVCPRFSPPNRDEMKLYQEKALELKNTLINTDNNVYPFRANRKKWYDSQYILFSFCEYLENIDYYQNKVNKPQIEGEIEAKHFAKCRQLVEAMNYIQDSINNAKY